jgi:hypothetical protein
LLSKSSVISVQVLFLLLISYIISVYCEDYAGYYTVILLFLAFRFCSAYFIYLVSCTRRGSHVSLSGNRRGGMKMSEYCREYCVPEAERQRGKVAIWGVMYITLHTILFTIARMVGSAAPHMALQSYFQYALKCLEPRVFNWADAVLRNLKKQLTKSRRGDLKQFVMDHC